jgi:hypothetical protein
VRAALVVAVLEHLGQRETEQSLVELNGPLDVRADDGEVVQAACCGGRTLAGLLEVGRAELVTSLADGVEVGGHAPMTPGARAPVKDCGDVA